MLLLFETAAGHALYELKNEDKLKALDASKLGQKLATPEACSKALSLKAFEPFKDTHAAVAAASEFVESKLGKPLKSFLKKHVAKNAAGVELGVADPKLGSLIKEKLGIPCVASSFVNECLRGARCVATPGLELAADGAVPANAVARPKDVRAMQLGLSHSLSRYKLKFSPDKVDTMVVQAVGLLDDLDKEVNTYAMRVKEWYGWHFPEMARLVGDNVAYAKIVKLRERTNFKDKKDEVAEILGDDDVAAETLCATAEMSMGTEVDASDMDHVVALADQVVELSAYRANLADYLRSRMQALAPNLTVLVGELVGARLVQHAGSIMNLAKHPASTVQILGAEKALFRALKTKHDTPKYGLIYHASLIGQAPPKHKGKIARVLAAKCSLATRVDALGEDVDATLGLEARAKVEARLRQLDGGAPAPPASNGKPKKLVEVVGESAAVAAPGYGAASDVVMSDKKAKKAKKKRDRESEGDAGDADAEAEAKRIRKAEKKARKAAEAEAGGASAEKPKKKKKKDAA
mmetsp:Transcript_29665/g.89261  ORF Transcript_29665/g.89261 Transcript_29665/m.89261 type:complete len:521 (+) Transcript_29665:216-1778(+)